MRIRPVRPESDLPGIVAIVSAFEREPPTVAALERRFAHMPAGRIARRMVATSEDDQVIGYSVAIHEAWWPDQVYHVWVGVDPGWRRQGVGLALAQDVQAFLAGQGALEVKAEVRDDDPVALRFAERYGFRVDRHLFSSRLDLSSFDERPYDGLIAAQQAAGIRFFTMADLGDSRAARLKLHELNRSTALDIPGADGTFMSFEEFDSWVGGADWYCPAGQLIAAEGDVWVGMAAVQILADTQGAHNLMTGVLQAYRGRKIALALKLLAIRYARSQGAPTISTENDSLNAPMLAINQKLGYRPQPGRYRLIRDR